MTMTGRLTVPMSARGNASMLRTLAANLTASRTDDVTLREARDVLRLDREQRGRRLDDRLANEGQQRLLSLCH